MLPLTTEPSLYLVSLIAAFCTILVASPAVLPVCEDGNQTLFKIVYNDDDVVPSAAAKFIPNRPIVLCYSHIAADRKCQAKCMYYHINPLPTPETTSR